MYLCQLLTKTQFSTHTYANLKYRQIIFISFYKLLQYSLKKGIQKLVY